MFEKRKAPRYKVQKSARIGDASGTSCVVKEMSATGARLSLSASTSLPDHFDLVMLGLTYPVQVVWRGYGSMDVTFRSAPKLLASVTGES